MSDALLPDDFNFWFGLKAAAADRDWEEMRRILQATGDQPLPRHPMTEQAFHAAARMGEVDLVQKMIARGYQPEADDVQKLLDWMVDEGAHPKFADALAATLAAMPPCDMGPYIRHVLGQEAHVEDYVRVLVAAKVEVLMQGGAMDFAIGQNRPDVLTALFNQAGLSPFTPQSVIARETLKKTDTAEARSLQAVFDTAAFDCRQAQQKIAQLQKRLSQNDGDLRAAMLVNPFGFDPEGAPVTLLGMLAAYDMLDDVLRPAHWRQKPDDILAVKTALEAYGLQDRVPLTDFAADLRRADLQARAQARPGLRLR